MLQPKEDHDVDAVTWADEEWNSLLEAIKYKQCTPFLGAGACSGTLPTGKAVAREWAEEVGYPFPDKDNLPRVAQYMAMREGSLGSMTPKLRISDRFSKSGIPDFSRPDEPHRTVADLNLPVYITTNYDNFMSMAIRRDGRRTPTVEVCDWKMEGRRTTRSRPPVEPSPEKPLVFHLHGTLQTPKTMVLTEDDYLDFLTNISSKPALIPSYVEEALSNSCLLFLGYSLNDMNFKVLFRKLAWYMRHTDGPRHISVQLAPRPMKDASAERELLLRQRDYLEAQFKLQKVKIYWGSCSTFAAELSARWSAYRDAGRA
jgi:hypothetical protein